VRQVIGEGKRVTYDLGGNAGTADMGEAIAERVVRLRA
jgi:isocitrate/isopropylmalate dehydrogenase